jgi:hypothetical protein
MAPFDLKDAEEALNVLFLVSFAIIFFCKYLGGTRRAPASHLPPLLK